jgi:hypothetical protein
MADAQLVAGLLKVAAALGGFPDPAGRPLPAVEVVPAAALKARACPAAADRCGDIAALHDRVGHRILIRADLDAGGPIGQSFLVHELVHVLQGWQRGEAETCVQGLADERQAYAVQNRFLAGAGRPERFGTMLAMMACAPDQAGARPDEMQLVLASTPSP